MRWRGHVNPMMRLAPSLSALTVCALALCNPVVTAQEAHAVRIEPAELTLPLGEKATLTAEVVDVGGRPVANAQVLFFSRARRSVRVTREGEVDALRAGVVEVVARSLIDGRRGPEGSVTITVPHPTPAAVRFDAAPEQVFAGTTTRLLASVVDANDVARKDLDVALAIDASKHAELDPFGHLTAKVPGTITLTAKGGGLDATRKIEILPNPVRSLELSASAQTVRTGDVVTFKAATHDGEGSAVAGVPVQFTFQAMPDDSLGNAATGQILPDGRFVAEAPGLYTIVATCGSATDRLTIRATERFEQKKKLIKVGHGPVSDVHTSDLWVWEGIDGRDYAVTGTWGANGEAIFWDVTNPAEIERIATVQVDARTVNDVKVSEDGRLCIISREGASDRKNGLVILNVADPRNPVLVSEYNDELTGGVHNLYIDKGFVYALSAGRRYDVIDIKDAGAPTRVGSYQIFEPGASIHDVWVTDGIAFSSNWRYGLRLVDVGNGIKGGSPSNPVEIGSYAYPSGWNHAAFPWKSKDTGKFYVVAGDEAFPYGLNTEDHPTYPRGWIHFVDFTDMENPDEIARYQVPEAGTHNLWIEDDVMYVAYYNAGLRVVDISGDLMGDLYNQGREIAWYLPTDPKGKVPNAPMTWGPQPHKGHIFISDWNSGLWALKLVDDNGRRR